MSASHQHSFAPNEFVYRRLSLTHTNSQPCEDERNQRHDILDATSPMQHDHANRYLPSARSQLRVVLTRTQEWE
jgi:hypothetical protein